MAPPSPQPPLLTAAARLSAPVYTCRSLLPFILAGSNPSRNLSYCPEWWVWAVMFLLFSLLLGWGCCERGCLWGILYGLSCSGTSTPLKHSSEHAQQEGLSTPINPLSVSSFLLVAAGCMFFLLVQTKRFKKRLIFQLLKNVSLYFYFVYFSTLSLFWFPITFPLLNKTKHLSFVKHLTSPLACS